jgi:hypothetical protein
MDDTTSLRDRIPDSVPDDIELFEQGGEVYGRDDHGEFKLDPMRGSAEPQDGRCGEKCRHSLSRYGEIRYCTAMPAKTFPGYESDYCKQHIGHENLMKGAEKLFEHGWFAENYINFVEKLPAAKFVLAVEMFDGLLGMSRHEFECERVTKVIDTEDADIIPEDAVSIELPIPQNTGVMFQANELWMAALDEVKVKNMQEAIFKQGMERKTLTESADMEGSITDTHYESAEHHLHLPVSRLTKDIKEHLKNGGVSIDEEDSGVVTFQKNDYTLDVGPQEDFDAEPEDHKEFSGDFTEQLQEEESEIEVETE